MNEQYGFGLPSSYGGYASNNALGGAAAGGWQNSAGFNFGQSYNPMNGVASIDSQIGDLKSQGIWGQGGDEQSGALGANIPTFQLGLSGLSALGNLWGAFQSNKLASAQFDFAKNMANKNLANQTQSYNTALTDRATARASMEGWSDAQTQDYINKNKLSN